MDFCTTKRTKHNLLVENRGWIKFFAKNDGKYLTEREEDISKLKGPQ